MKKKLIKIGMALLTGILFVSTYYVLNHALLRKTKYGNWNYLVKVGNFHLIEENTLDVVVLGSSHAYCSIDNLLLKEEYGIESYTLATQQQSLKC